MKKNTDEKQILFLVTILLSICYNKLWKKILTKNKFVFSHYPFMKKNTDEKQICF